MLTRLGMVGADIRTYGDGLLDVPTVTMELTVGAGTQGPSRGPRTTKKRASARSKRAGGGARGTRPTRPTES